MPARRPVPAALLLDLDGTLVDSEPIHRAAYEAFFADQGWEVTDLTPFTGRRAADVFGSTPGPWSGADPDHLAAAVVSHIPADAAPEPVPGARRLVEAAAAADVPVAVVTSAGPGWARSCLADVLQVDQHVRVIITADDVAHGKPDPAGYTLACALLSVEPPGCTAIEDSPAGIRAARAAGVLAVCGLSTTHTREQLLAAGAAEVAADLVGLAARIGLSRCSDDQE